MQAFRESSPSELDRLIVCARLGSQPALMRLLENLSECLWAELIHRRKLRGIGPAHSLSDLIQDTLARVGENAPASTGIRSWS